MNLEERMKMYKESVQVKSKEEKIQKQSVNQKMPFLCRTRTNAFLPRIFMDTASCDTKKWWVLQFMLLVAYGLP